MPTYSEIENIQVKNRDNIDKNLFKRNNQDKCWQIIKNINENNEISSFVISIYDEDVNVTNCFKFHFYCFGNYATYYFDEFFNPQDYVFDGAQKLQEEFLKTINYLIEQEVIEFDKN